MVTVAKNTTDLHTTRSPARQPVRVLCWSARWRFTPEEVPQPPRCTGQPALPLWKRNTPFPTYALEILVPGKTAEENTCCCPVLNRHSDWQLCVRRSQNTENIGWEALLQLGVRNSQINCPSSSTATVGRSTVEWKSSLPSCPEWTWTRAVINAG